MSFLYFCPNCGNNLTHISNQRLKCYKCEKYFTEDFVCACETAAAFTYSLEIIGINKVKCFFCGEEAQVPASLEPPYIDKYKGSAKSGGLGSWDGQVGSFQPPSRKFKTARPAKQKAPEKTPEIEKPEVDYISENQDHIVIRFPGHERMEKIRCEIINGILEVESRLVNFLEKFPLPNFPVELETEFRNGILNISLKKKIKNK